MNDPTLALALYKANTELQLRLAQLVQESGHRYLDAAQRISQEGVEEASGELKDLLESSNWQSLATLPAESFWRAFRQRAGEAHAINQMAIDNQKAFAVGLQQAIAQWQQAISKAAEQCQGDAQPGAPWLPWPQPSTAAPASTPTDDAP